MYDVLLNMLTQIAVIGSAFLLLVLVEKTK